MATCGRDKLPNAGCAGRADDMGLESTLNDREQCQLSRHILFFQLLYNGVQEWLGARLNPLNVGRVVHEPSEFAVNVGVTDLGNIVAVEQSIPKIVVTSRVGEIPGCSVGAVAFFELDELSRLIGTVVV